MMIFMIVWEGKKHMISRIYTVHMDDLVRLLQYHDLLEETCGFPDKKMIHHDSSSKDQDI
jgi:hypothetical protein